MTSYIPSRKVTAGTLGGGPLGIVVVWVLQTFILPEHVVMPAEVAAAIGALISMSVAYWVPDKA